VLCAINQHCIGVFEFFGRRVMDWRRARGQGRHAKGEMRGKQATDISSDVPFDNLDNTRETCHDGRFARLGKGFTRPVLVARDHRPRNPASSAAAVIPGGRSS
jgi:hypothetical protein